MKCLGTPGGVCLHECLIVNAVAGLAVGLVLTDRSGKVVWINRTAEKLLGTTVDECYGRAARRIFKSPQLSAFWQDAVQTKENAHAEVTVRSPREMDLKLNATRCLDAQGHETGRALLVCDVTQERAVQVKLSQAVVTRLLALTTGHMPPEPVADLTQRELRILRLVGQGLGNIAIARKSSISPSTVRSHLKNLYRKLNLGSRAEAVSFAIRHHLA
jgi:PAS domain S-box-containing protein